MSRLLIAALVAFLFLAVLVDGTVNVRFVPLDWGVSSADRKHA